MRQDVQTASVVENEIGDDISMCKSGFEYFACEKAPVTRQWEIRFLQRAKIRRNLDQGELVLER